MSTSTLSLRLQEIVAIIKGDDAEATGIKIIRQATNALTPQISVKESLTYDLEERVEEAKDNLKKLLVNNGVVIENKEGYIRRLLEANQAIKVAEEALEDHVEEITFLKECLTRVGE